MSYTLYEWAVAYLDHAKNRHAEKTYAEKRIAFQQLFKSVDPHIHASRLHKGQVLSHMEHQARTRSGNAANKDRKNLLAAWNWAVQYLPSFPQETPFKVLRCAEERSPRYIPPEKDFWAVYNVAESAQDRLMLLCYLHLAARRNEIFHLRREDVDLDRKKVRLHTRKRRDGSQHCDWLPMTEILHKAFSDHLAVVSGTWAFTDPKTGFPFLQRDRWMKHLCAKAGVPRFDLHSIRHLSASILVNHRVPLPEVQAVLRHANLTTTQRYVHRMQTGSCLASVFDSHKEILNADIHS
jgi:integrase